MTSEKFIQIDEDGYLLSNELRVTDREYGYHLLSQVQMDDFGGFYTTFAGTKIIIEAFDCPLVIKQVHRKDESEWVAICPYDLELTFNLNTLCLDEWDRFHCYTKEKIPMVFSRSAQADMFNLVDDFDDDSVTVNENRYELPPFLVTPTDTSTSQFWDDKYREKEVPGWELNAPSSLLVSSLAQLKVPKSRVLVPGCGSGSDAAYLAEQGHIVTAIDFSKEAISRAKEKYGAIPNLTFIEANILSLDSSFSKAFDLIFDHTSFCAIPLDKRQKMIKVWLNCLDEGGLLFAIFFVMHRMQAPPFGGTEWEYRQRMKNNFQFLYWTRWKEDNSWRLGKELVVYARKTK